MSIRGYARGPCPAFCLVFACLLFSELHLLAADLGNGAASPGGVCLESGECTSKGKFTYLIGSGWHASVSGFHPLSKINTRVDATVRTPSWFPLWYSHLLHFTSPVQVVVADSDSPVKPQHVGSEEQSRHYPLLQWVQLTQNFGHEAISVSPTVGGWERSVLQGAFQAILNDVDYYVYVEQDVLVRVSPGFTFFIPVAIAKHVCVCVCLDINTTSCGSAGCFGTLIVCVHAPLVLVRVKVGWNIAFQISALEKTASATVQRQYLHRRWASVRNHCSNRWW
eukprot:INCI16298.2.p1 GENE.INCI16298.2~~INCI16298.2.p1  ORF type:complete len:280 (+),score=30.75 INCI16298.2:220-1059(+)